jgi:PAS domain S-box-containing protein
MDSPVLMVSVVVGAIGLGFLVALIVGRKWNHIGSLADRAGSLLNRHPLYQVWPQAIIRLDSRGTIRFLNQAAGLLFGYVEHDVRGQPVSQLIRGAAFRNGAGNRGSPTEVLPSSAGIATEGITRDGAVFPAHCVALGRSFILVLDESERVRLEEAQRRAQLLTAALQAIATPLLIVDRHSRVIVANHACDAVFRSPVRAGTELLDLFPDAKLDRGTRRLTHASSGYVFTSPLDQNGADPGNLVLFGWRDHPRRRLEDLLTEMNAYSELLLSEIASDSAMREDLERVHAASAEAIAVIRDIRW